MRCKEHERNYCYEWSSTTESLHEREDFYDRKIAWGMSFCEHEMDHFKTKGCMKGMIFYDRTVESIKLIKTRLLRKPLETPQARVATAVA